MGVKLGYKQTEVGVIPEDWEICEFQEVMTGFSSGQTPSRTRPEYYTGSIPWITSGELNYGIITDTFEKITFEALEKTNLKIIPKGTFLFAITGLEAEGTRGSCGITGIDAATNQSCMALYPKNRLLLTEYLFHFYIRHGDLLALKYCQGTKQQSYNGHIAKKLPIILPPTLAEQTAIATVLSDADALIQSLKRLITKKRDIKQGAMQELLTGKKRLPGFEKKKGCKQTEVGVIPEDWEIKSVGDIAVIVTGSTPPTKMPANYGVEFLFASPADLGKNKYIVDTEKRLSKMGFLISRKFPIGSILFTCIGSTIGKCGIAIEEMTSNQQINTIFPSSDFANEYIYYVLDLLSPRIKALAGVQAVPIINKTQFATTLVPFPPLPEQSAIATILSDIDAEIAALDSKLAKARQIKQGMMQELLTGRIRLVCENQ
jgi:type I restriction enzyme S subunit